MSFIDLLSPDTVTVVLIEVEAGSFTFRWCGPQTRTTSGFWARIAPGIVGPLTYAWEPRITEIETDEDIGGLDNHVQVVSQMSIFVRCGGKDDRSRAYGSSVVSNMLLLEAAQHLRWEGGRCRAWTASINPVTGRQTSDIPVPLWTGHVDSEPKEIGLDGFGLSITAGIVAVNADLPLEEIPAGDESPPEWSHDSDVTVGSYGTSHTWHPNDYRLSPSKWGRFLGLVWGPAKGAGATWPQRQIWKECYFYGRQTTGVTIYQFIHVSPQFNCYVHELAYEDPDNSQIQRRVDSSVTLSFNNYDVARGPIGTNVRIAATTAVVSDWWSEPFPRVVARVSGPGSAHETGPADSHCAGDSIQLLAHGTAAEWRDDEILEQIFDMAGYSAAWGTAALSTFASTAPLGPIYGTDQYRHMGCAVHPEIVDRPPTMRDALGELLFLVQADLVQKPDGADLSLFPLRRRPNPVQPDADHVIRDSDLLTGHGGRMRDWVRLSDPDGIYLTALTVDSPEFLAEPTSVAGGDDTDDLAPTMDYSGTHTDTFEETQLGAVRSAKESLKWWIPTYELPELDAHGWNEAVDLAGATRSQRQVVVEVTIGPRGMGMHLGDTVEYDIAGLVPDGAIAPGTYAGPGVGHIRRKTVDWATQAVTLTTYHNLFFEGSRAAPSGADDAGVGSAHTGD